MAVLLSGCAPRHTDDPRLEWAYATAPEVPGEPVKAGALPRVQLRTERAHLGAVIRDIARQAGITAIYPASFDDMDFTGEIDGPGDAVLDALARRADLRFQLNAGVGLIGKPVPGDRSVAVLRVPFPDASKVIQPLLSEGAKVSETSGWIFVTDRAEILQKIVAAVQSMRPRSYAVQLLEVYVLDGFNASLTSALTLELKGTTLTGLLDSQVSAALLDEGAYLGRTWTGVISEGKKFAFFVGGSENRTQTLANDHVLATNTLVVQTGWHFEVSEYDRGLEGSVFQDGTDATQYRVDFSLPSPGLYLVHASDLAQRHVGWGFPSLFHTTSRTKRYVWVRYQPLGTLLDLPPADGTDRPRFVAEVPPAPGPFFAQARPSAAAPAARAEGRPAAAIAPATTTGKEPQPIALPKAPLRVRGPVTVVDPPAP